MTLSAGSRLSDSDFSGALRPRSIVAKPGPGQTGKGDTTAAIGRTLQADLRVVETEQAALTPMIALKEGCGSFADALIGALGAKAGCSGTLTFDRKVLRLPGVAPQ